MMQNGVVYTDS